MQEDDRPNSKAKVIVWCTVLAAVVIIYIVVTSMNNTQTSNTATTTPSTTTQASDTSSRTATDSTDNQNSSSSNYADGTYSSDVSYRTPENSESISVTLIIKDGTVTSSSLDQSENDRESAEYQGQFASSYETYVVGKKLSGFQLSHISGASLTTSAFNKAVADIESQAESQA